MNSTLKEVREAEALIQRVRYWEARRDAQRRQTAKSNKMSRTPAGISGARFPTKGADGFYRYWRGGPRYSFDGKFYRLVE